MEPVDVTPGGPPAPPAPAVAPDDPRGATTDGDRPSVLAARALVSTGAVTEGLAALEALRPGLRRMTPHDRVLLLAGLVECRLARGDMAEAMALGDTLSPLLDAGGETAALAHHAKGELALALGDPELALAHFLTAGRLAPDLDLDLAPWRAGAALASTRTGDPRGAAVLAHRLAEAARTDARPPVLALALRTLAAVDPAGGAADRLAHLRTARSLLRPGTADRLAAQIDTDLAGLLVMSTEPSDHEEAVALLRGAERLATRHDLWPLQSRVRRHLERLGQVPRRVDTEALALLTASELKVCRLAVEGLSNKRVAAELGVSVKAVEWHLGHVYRKLAITSRAGLADALGTSF